MWANRRPSKWDSREPLAPSMRLAFQLSLLRRDDACQFSPILDDTSGCSLLHVGRLDERVTFAKSGFTLGAGLGEFLPLPFAEGDEDPFGLGA